MKTKICKTCGNRFSKPYKYSIGKWKEAKYCSNKCRRTRKLLKCPVCNKDFLCPPSRDKKNKASYCSSVCYYKSRTGKPNYGNPHKGHKVKFNCSQCGKEGIKNLSKYIGYKYHFCSQKCWGKFFGKLHSGEGHYAWSYGRSPEENRLRMQPAYQEWRRAVYKRDWFTCQDCGAKDDIVAHHVFGFKDFPNLRYEVDNGIVLCRGCHARRHNNMKLEIKQTQSMKLQESKI